MTPAPNPDTRSRRPFRNLSRSTLAVIGVVTLVLLLIVIGEIAGWPFLRGPVERRLTAALERPVVLGTGFRVQFLGSLRVSADTLSVAPPAWDSGRRDPSPFVDATDAFLKLPYSTLWNLYRKNPVAIHVDALRVGDIRARLLREKDGRANWTLLPAASGPASDFQVPEFDELVLRSGHIVFDDAVSAMAFDAKVSTREGASAASPSAASSASSEAASTAASTAASKDASTDAGLVASGTGKYRGNPLTFRIASDGVLPLLATDKSGPLVRLAFDARAGASSVKFDGRAIDVFRLTGVEGTYAVKGPSLAAIGDTIGVTLPTTAAFSIQGRLEKNGKVYSTDVRKLSVGSSELNGNFRFDTTPQTPLLTGELKGRRLALADLGPAVGAGTSKGAPNPPPPPGKVLPQREFDLPSLKAMNAAVKVRLTQADFGSELLQPLAPLVADLKLQQGVLSLENLLARTAGGEVRGLFRLDGTRPLPLFATDLRWSGVELERWIKAKNARDEKARAGAAPPPYITGSALGTAKLTGSGRSTAAILGSLDGSIATGVQQGTVSHLIVEAAGLDLAQGIGLLFEGDDALKMDCALVQMTAKNGVATADVGIVDTTDTTLLVSGQVSLSQETLGLKLTAKPKDVSPLTLRAPLNVSGTFADPSIRPEGKNLSIKLLAAAVLAAVNPLAAVIPLVDLGDKTANAGCLRSVAQLRRPSSAAAGSP